ncbi:MAG TPA: LytR C-terminal domain-containing protein [Gaiellaceae bacterium]|nr:LytR C-terminal domain-containing protein [Gaiellaceae bacterium]
MEHAHPLPDRPWKTAAVLASAVAVVELAALVVLAVGAIAEPVAQEAQRVAVERTLAPVERPAPTPKAKPSSKPVALPRGETAVVVLNGNGVAGAAAGVGERIKGLGYVLGAVGNAPRSDYARTLVMYRPGREAEARRLAKDLGVRVVAPLDGLTPTELLGAHVALVLGAR